MNTYRVHVGQDGSNGFTEYTIQAETMLDARIIAFAIDGGFGIKQSKLERGHIELVKMWTSAELISVNTERLAALEDRVHQLEQRLLALEAHQHRLADVVSHEIIDVNCSPESAPSENPTKYRPCKPNPISYRKGDSSC